MWALPVHWLYAASIHSLSKEHFIAAGPAQSITRPLTGHAQYGPADAHSPPIIAINSKKFFHIVNYKYILISTQPLLQLWRHFGVRFCEFRKPTFKCCIATVLWLFQYFNKFL